MAFSGTVKTLTLVNVSVSLLGLVSGAIQARALGPEGRGELAAVIVPLFVVGVLGDLGLGLYSRREAARSVPLGLLVGTVVPTVAAVGVVLAIALIPAIDVVARGRSVVALWLTIGLLLLPVNLVGGILMSVAIGLERWELWVRVRLLVAVGWVVVLGTLYVLDGLTVSAASASYLGLTLASYVPLVHLLRQARPMRFQIALARRAVPFGLQGCLAGLTNLANTRLDQLLMAALLSSRELGLYAAAVTLAAAPSTFSGAVGLGILPRVVRAGEPAVPRKVRITLVLVVVASAVLALASWPIVHFALGQAFDESLPMVWILLAAEIPLAGTVALGQALIGSGHPGRTAVAEGLALIVTVAGLALVLRNAGGMGAAIVSVAAYSVSFGYLLLQSRKVFRAPVTGFLVPTTDDITSGIRTAWRLITAAARRSGPGARPL